MDAKVQSTNRISSLHEPAVRLAYKIYRGRYRCKYSSEKFANFATEWIKSKNKERFSF